MKKDMKLYSNRRFAENFRRLMFINRLTLKEISEATEVPVSTLSTWKRGRLPREGASISKLARLFNVSRDELIGGDKNSADRVIFVNERPAKAFAIEGDIREHVEALIKACSGRAELAKLLKKLKKEFPLGK